MNSPLKTQQHRSQREREPIGRGHVRPATPAEDEQTSRRREHVKPAASSPAAPAPRRMTPLARSDARSAPNLTRRRADRRARRQRAQVRRSSTKTQRRAAVPTVLFSWRAVSGMIVLGLSVVLYLFLTAEAFYVNSIAVGGEIEYYKPQEVFRDSDVAQRHIFWLDEGEIEKRLEQVPYVADASVFVGWPPDMVQIMISERKPALTWQYGGLGSGQVIDQGTGESEGTRFWVDINGIVMRQREDRSDLLLVQQSRLREEEGEQVDDIDLTLPIPEARVRGALQLQNLSGEYSIFWGSENFDLDREEISVLMYDPVRGLGYVDGRWTVWFGEGDDIETKLTVYQAIADYVLTEESDWPAEIVVSNPDYPYFRRRQ
ncbi:MAG: FtsQ-type POTRA domain-containing protein [Chloroflexi bacterium]|nr:FtsQ-type POTRA domain-containing protein [Chloroflexota bacterium]